jgi:hypothetical protein
VIERSYDGDDSEMATDSDLVSVRHARECPGGLEKTFPRQEGLGKVIRGGLVIHAACLRFKPYA